MKVFLIVLGVLVLGVAGYFGNEYRACSALENDYLNAVAEMRGNIAIRSFASDPDLLDMLEKSDDLAIQQVEKAMEGLYSRCGESAGQTAFRKGQDMLLGI